MILLRLLFILTALVLVFAGGMYVFTRDRRYLDFTRQFIRLLLYLLLLFGLLFVLERYVLTGWGILL